MGLKEMGRGYDNIFKKELAPGEDRTHDLQIALVCDYETDALPTALPRQLWSVKYNISM